MAKVEEPKMSGGWANSPEDEDDEDDEEIERAEDEASSPGGVADATPGVTVDKRAVKNRAAEAEKELDSDIAEAQDALELFLNSRFAEAERRLSAKNGRSLYHTLGYATISYLRALFTFDPSDVRKATESLRNAVEIAAIYKKETSLVSSFTSMMTRSKEGSHIKHMTKLQRHAELVHAEAHLAKSMLSLITDSNIIAFVREGLNIRAAYNSYKNCYKFLQRTYDEEGGAQGLAKAGIDEHFVSGILLGIGAFNLSLSMMPAKVLRLFELIGFSGDRDFGLSRLEIGGEWPIRNRAGIYDHKVKPAARPKSATRKSDEDIAANSQTVPFAMPHDSGSGVSGVRKALCDLVLLGYHIILSSLVQLPDCDMDFAKQILAYNLERHPNSFIFLAMRARVAQTEGNPAQAISEYKRVIEIQNEWRQLVHLCIWDSATCYGALGNWSDAHDMHETLFKESKWSKAIYKYLQAISLYAQDINGDKKEQVGEMLKEVPKLTKKIAGKSIPMEKFVSRKCRKWQLQGGRLFLPHFEMLYIMNGFDIIPQSELPNFLARLDNAIQDLETQAKQAAPTAKQSNMPYPTYYDDLCLVRLLKGVLTRESATPHSQTLFPVTTLAKQPPPTADQQQALDYAARQFEYVVMHADKIHLDHWIVPFTRLEAGKLYVRSRQYEKARKEYTAALSGGFAEDEVGHNGAPKKYSLENALHFRVHNAIVKLDALERVSGESR